MEPDVAGGGGGEPKHRGLGGRGRAGDYSCPGHPDPRRPPHAGLGTLSYNRRARGALFLTPYVRGQPSVHRPVVGSLCFLTWSSSLWQRTSAPFDQNPVGVLCQEDRVCLCICVSARVRVFVCVCSFLTFCGQFWPNWHFSRVDNLCCKRVSKDAKPQPT